MRTSRWLVFSSLLALACGKGPTDVNVEEYLPGTGDITVTGGRMPTFSWSGGEAELLSVSLLQGETVWQFSSSYNTSFGPPVKYGVLPPNGRCGIVDDHCQDPIPLSVGSQYQVIIYKADGKPSWKIFTVK